MPAAKVRRIFGVCKFICNILIKIQVPLFPRGMKGTKNFYSFKLSKKLGTIIAMLCTSQ